MMVSNDKIFIYELCGVLSFYYLFLFVWLYCECTLFAGLVLECYRNRHFCVNAKLLQIKKYILVHFFLGWKCFKE